MSTAALSPCTELVARVRNAPPLPGAPVDLPKVKPHYVYVLVRSDIEPEQQLVQAAHATLEAGFRFRAPDQTAHLVALSVASEAELLQAAARLEHEGVEHHVFFEPDNAMGHSALATEPLQASRLRRQLKRYPLLRLSPGASSEGQPACQ